MLIRENVTKEETTKEKKKLELRGDIRNMVRTKLLHTKTKRKKTLKMNNRATKE